jgi:hypothetical protein
MANVVDIDLVGDRAKKVRRILGRCVKSAIDAHGGDIAGFALVSWDMRGNARSAILDNVGPVAMALVPTYVHDALNRHVAIELARSSAPEEVTGE